MITLQEYHLQTALAFHERPRPGKQLSLLRRERPAGTVRVGTLDALNDWMNAEFGNVGRYEVPDGGGVVRFSYLVVKACWVKIYAVAKDDGKDARVKRVENALYKGFYFKNNLMPPWSKASITPPLLQGQKRNKRVTLMRAP